MKPSARKCLQAMAHQESLENWADAELVCKGTVCYLKSKRIYWHTVKEMLQLLTISSRGSEGNIQRYMLNSVGRSILRRPELEQEVKDAQAKGGSWTIQFDKVARL